MTKSTAACNYAGRPSPWHRMSAKYPNRLTQGEQRFSVSEIQKRASDIAMLYLNSI
jgi:hypothetical protein